MIDMFDLNLFSRTFFLNSVRKTNFFQHEDIFDVLESKVKEIECETEEANKQILSLKNKIKSLQSYLHQVEIKSEQDNKSKEMEVQQLNVNLGNLENMWQNADRNLLLHAEVVGKMPRPRSENKLSCMVPHLVSPYQNYLGESPGVMYKLNSTKYVNKVQFTLMNTADISSSDYYCSYTIESSTDKNCWSWNWSTVVDFTGLKCRGRQTVFFEKRPMMYMCVRLKNYDGAGKYFFEIDESDAVLMLDTTSGARVNLGQF